MTQDEIIEMARQAGLHLVGTEHNQAYTEVIEAFAKMVDAKATAREREACAKICENMDCDEIYCQGFANAIRSRTVESIPTPPPEAQTEAERTAFCFGWWKAMETRKPWVGLTDKEILDLWEQTYVQRGTSGLEFARDFETKLKEKNT